MTLNQRIWAKSRDRLAAAVSMLGYPEEFAGLISRQLGSPQAIDRMTSYLNQAHPESMEMIIDEMLAIREEIDAWQRKKESREAQEGYNRWLGSDARQRNRKEALRDSCDRSGYGNCDDSGEKTGI